MGISGTSREITCCFEHPVDTARKLYFLSDFPHLIKCLKNSLLKNEFNTPAGHVSLMMVMESCNFVAIELTRHFFFFVQVTIVHVKEAHRLDGPAVTMKAMHAVSLCHIQPNNFENMRLGYAFKLFGAKILRSLHLYKPNLEECFDKEKIEVTITFFE